MRTSFLRSRSTHRTSFKEVCICRHPSFGYHHRPLIPLTGLDEAQSTVLIEEIVSWGSVDILEISGGNYSSPGESSIPRSMLQSFH